MEPDAKALYEIRKHLEHSYLKVHDPIAGDSIDSMGGRWKDAARVFGNARRLRSEDVAPDEVIGKGKLTRLAGVLMLPVQCNMLDLSALQARHVQGPFLMHQLIGAENGFPPTMGSYRRNMVRLADKAVRDYTDARNFVIAQIQEMQRAPQDMAEKGRFVFMHLVTDRLEDCIVTVRRLFRYFERVKSDPTGFPLERLLKPRIEALEDSIREVRNLIEHLDSDISGGNVQQGESTAPVLDAETRVISLAGAQLPVEVLARAIQRFHEFATDFAQYRRTPDGRYEHMPKSTQIGG
jgi:hypothetical protein